MTEEFLIAGCLVLVIEGVMPFLIPQQWREAMSKVIALDDQTIRIMGLSSMLMGTLLLYLVH